MLRGSSRTEERLVWARNWGLQAITVGKAWRLEPETAAHPASSSGCGDRGMLAFCHFQLFTQFGTPAHEKVQAPAHEKVQAPIPGEFSVGNPSQAHSELCFHGNFKS